MGVITKSALERRKKRFREKIEKIKTDTTNSEKGQRRTDSCFEFVVIENCGMITASCPNELNDNLDEMSCTDIRDSETLKNSVTPSTRNARKRHRRQSVVAKMNKAIRRRTRGR